MWRFVPIFLRSNRTLDLAGNNRPVMLGFGAWSRYFDRDPNIVGKTITLDNQAYTVVGVTPADFAFPNNGVEMWSIPGFDLHRISRRS